MPKGNELYPERLDFFVSKEMRLQMIGVSFLMGSRGRHAEACRKILELGLKAYLDSLPPKKYSEYEFIMTRVRVADDPKNPADID